MIIVTGANGKLGHAVVERLLARRPAEGIGVSVRDPRKAKALAERGVRVRQGDFTDPVGLRHAFADATQVLIVSSNARASGGDPLAQHHHAIDAAKAAGARRVLYTSHMAAGAASLFPPMRDHAATETILRESGLAFTALRNGFYADTVPFLIGDAPQTGRLVAPADGPVSWTAHADLAEAIAVVLADEGRLDGVTPPLTGGDALDLAAVATLAAELTGREIERLTVADEEYRAGLVARGLPDAAVDISMGLFAAARKGEFASVDPTLERLIGRKPVPLRESLATHLQIPLPTKE